jgi:hypothetical protein
LLTFTVYFVPGLISSTGVCQSMKQNATSFEDPARYIEIAYFWACSQNCEKQQFASSGLSVHPSVRIEQPGPQFKIFVKFDL